jgi:hypothetical protein
LKPPFIGSTYKFHYKAYIGNGKQGIYPDGGWIKPLNIPGFSPIYLRCKREMEFV